MSSELAAGVTHGTTNVFADLGMPDAVERQTKTHLAMQVNELLKGRRLKQVEAASVLGVPQPKVSALANYRLDGISVEKLMEFLTLLNQDVEILICPTREHLAPGHVSVHAVRQESAMAGQQPFTRLTEGLPPEPPEKIAAKATRASARQNGAAPELNESYVREREAVLDKLVAEAQKHDMGYKRS